MSKIEKGFNSAELGWSRTFSFNLSPPREPSRLLCGVIVYPHLLLRGTCTAGAFNYLDRVCSLGLEFMRNASAAGGL